MKGEGEMQPMTTQEVRAHLRAAIKAKYRNLKSYAYDKGITPQRVYEFLNRGPIPKDVQAEFGIEQCDPLWRLK